MFRLPVCLERVELILQNKKMKFEERNMKTTMLPEESDAQSPAGADIRFLMDGKTGDMIHSTVPPHQINKATVHATVSEFWYVLEGMVRFGEMTAKRATSPFLFQAHQSIFQ